MRWRSVLAAAAAVAVLAAPATAQTVQDALQVVPKEAVAFAVVNKLSEVSAKVVELAEHVGQPLPFGPPLEAFKKQLGINKGLNDDGAALLAVLPGASPDAEPIGLVYVPTADYQELLKELKIQGTGEIREFQPPKGPPLVIANKGSFAVVTKAEHKDALQKALSSSGGAAGVAGLQKWLSSNCVSGVLTHKGLKLFSAKAREGLDKAKQGLAAAPNPDAADLAGAWIDGMSHFFKSAESDVHGLGVGLRVDKAGNVHVTGRALFAKGSGFAKAAAEFHAPEGGALAGLPARSFVLALGGSLPEEAMHRLVQASAQMMKIGLKDAPEESRKKIEEAYADMGKGIHGMAFLVAVPREGEALLHGVMGLARVDDAETFLKRQEKSSKALSEAMKGLNLPFAMPITTKRVKVGGRPALETITDLSGIPNVAALGGILEPIVGSGDKITATAVAVDDKTILTTYTTPKGAEKLLQSAKAKGSFEEMPSVSKVAALLPKGAQWIGYFSPHGTMEFVKRVTALAQQLGAPVPTLPEMAQTPPIGMALKVTQAGVESELVVPAATIQGVARYAREIRKQQEGGQ